MKYGNYSRESFEYFCQIGPIIPIDPYNFELYRFKVGSFFETQCRNGFKIKIKC